MGTAAATQAQIAVLGAGSWGTALAIQWARAGNSVRLWGREAAQLTLMSQERVNRRYLPNALFPESLHIAPTLTAALEGVDDVLVAVPSHAFREVLTQLKSVLSPAQRLCWATKGFEISSGRLPHEVAQQVLGSGQLTAVLSGPTFAREVGAGRLGAPRREAEHEQRCGATGPDVGNLGVSNEDIGRRRAKRDKLARACFERDPLPRDRGRCRGRRGRIDRGGGAR